MTVNGASDPLVGGLASGVAGGEYWIDTAAPAAARGTPVHRLDRQHPGRPLATGTHTIGARVRDAAGNWSAVTPRPPSRWSRTLIFSNGFDTGGAPWGWTQSLHQQHGPPQRHDDSRRSSGPASLQAQGNNTNYVQYNFGTTANPAGRPTTPGSTSTRTRNTGDRQGHPRRPRAPTRSTDPLFRVRYRLNAGHAQVQIQVGATANATWTKLTNGAPTTGSRSSGSPAPRSSCTSTAPEPEPHGRPPARRRRPPRLGDERRQRDPRVLRRVHLEAHGLRR